MDCAPGVQWEQLRRPCLWFPLWLLLASSSFVLVSVFTRSHWSCPLLAFLPKYLGSASFPGQHENCHVFGSHPVDTHLTKCLFCIWHCAGWVLLIWVGHPPRTPACPSLCFRSLGPIPLLFEDAFKLVFVLWASLQASHLMWPLFFFFFFFSPTFPLPASLLLIDQAFKSSWASSFSTSDSKYLTWPWF